MSNEWPRVRIAAKGRIVYSAEIGWTKTCANHQGPSGKRGHRAYCPWHCKNAMITEESLVIWDKDGGPCLVAPDRRSLSDWDSLNPRFAESLYKPDGIQNTLSGAGLTLNEATAVIQRADGKSFYEAAKALHKASRQNVRTQYERGKAKLVLVYGVTRTGL